MKPYSWAYDDVQEDNKRNVKFSKTRSKAAQEKKKSLFSIKSSNYQSFGPYLKKTLKTSLITSIPEIASTKSWAKRTIKSVVFVVCLVGFAYQTMDFLGMYLAYPTVVNVLVTNPYEIVQPSITLCNHNRLSHVSARSGEQLKEYHTGQLLEEDLLAISRFWMTSLDFFSMKQPHNFWTCFSLTQNWISAL
ncbi:uncharacterized protein CEXT_527661 [Caerostris extrusa]|uniref:Uncharacterized protein n=1 Tax=Caerostris extrusa TaxID=172846 RepID=A0AAV4NLF7_CAEEX|nr:uncharacterized protein CEXT_527661 [Caerostris extrusa]